jgi:hypothetical protein
MKSKSDFWLVLHQLAGELQIEADNDHDRVEHLATVQHHLPEATRNMNCANLEFVIGVLNRLATACRSSGCSE